MAYFIGENMNTLMNEFIYELRNNKFNGDMLEFGTGSGSSTDFLAQNFKNNIFTFDGFEGLPETKKVVPRGTGWQKGSLKFDEQKTRNLLSKYSHVFVNKIMTYDLKNPEDYGIKKIAAANMDLDLYEGTLDALNFIDKCEWNNILLRFDDWGFYRNTSQIKEEVEQHEQAAFEDFIKEKRYEYKFFHEYANLCDNRQCIIEVIR